MERRDFLKVVGASTAGVVAGESPSVAADAQAARPVSGPAAQPGAAPRVPRWDIHTHHYTPGFFETVRASGGEFSFGTDPTGRTIITYKGSRFFGVQPAMTDVKRRLDDMDRAGVDVAVISLSTPNVFFTTADRQPFVARMMNDAYAETRAAHPTRFRCFASIPMDNPDEALKELHRAINTLKLNGVVLLSNIGGKALTSPQYRPFFQEANRMKLCIFLHPMLPLASEPYQEYVLGPIIGFPADTTLAVARMCFDGMFKDFPDIRWIIGHAGGTVPFLMERMDSGWRDFAETKVKIDQPPSVYLKKLYYDTVTFSQHNLRMLRDMVGADHMLMGSDYPHLLGSIEKAVTSIETMPIPEAEKAHVFSGTARSILNNL